MSDDGYESPAIMDQRHVRYCLCSDLWDDIFNQPFPVGTSNTALPRLEIDDDEPQPPPLPEPCASVTLGRRTSYDAQKSAGLDEATIREDVLAWHCEGKRCGRCLTSVCDTEVMLSDAVSNILALRQTTYARPQHQIVPFIRHTLGTCLRLTGSTLQYVVSGVRVCKEAWNWAHGFSQGTSARVHADFNAWWRRANPKTRRLQEDCHTATGPTSMAERWILEWITLAMHNPPNATRSSVPPISAAVLYPQYEAWCNNNKTYPIQRDGFRGKMSTIKASLDVATRASKTGSKECPVCSVLKRSLSEATGLYLKREIKSLHAQHIAFTNGEVRHYLDHSFESQDNPQVCYVIFWLHQWLVEILCR